MKRYFHFLQKQPHYVQKIHAGFFAGVITLFLAFIWLYYEYGFWNEKYNRTEETVKAQQEQKYLNTSPFDMLSNIYNEGILRAKQINISPSSLLESSTTYNFIDKK